METKTIRLKGKTWILPIVLSYNYHLWFYNVIDFRKPKKREYYISGAIPQLYMAPNNLNTKYLIAQKTNRAKYATYFIPIKEE